MKYIIVKDDGSITEAQGRAGEQFAAYAQFAYGQNGLTKADAESMASEAAKQQARENKHYGK
jgi:hypothetical protein